MSRPQGDTDAHYAQGTRRAGNTPLRERAAAQGTRRSGNAHVRDGRHLVVVGLTRSTAVAKLQISARSLAFRAFDFNFASSSKGAQFKAHDPSRSSKLMVVSFVLHAGSPSSTMLCSISSTPSNGHAATIRSSRACSIAAFRKVSEHVGRKGK